MVDSADPMKAVLSRYRDPALARKLVARIWDLARDLPKIRIMHVCGTHEWTITHWGIRALLPDNIEVRAGPGCPVCITPASDIDVAVKLALDGINVLTYGDVSRAKGSRMISLEDCAADGGKVGVVYSFMDAVRIASSNPDSEYVFLGAGFETTAPTVAYYILKGLPRNLKVLSAHRYVPPAVGFLAESEDLEIDAFINPGHASTVSGMKAYKPYFDRCGKPMVFAGFEPIDVLVAIYMILKQLRENAPRMENEYVRSVTWEGNLKAQKALQEVFDFEDGYWRGVAIIPASAMNLKEKFSQDDARRVYGLERGGGDYFPQEARCAEIIKGIIDPPDCPLYMKACMPSTPIGPPMVGLEGTCRIWAQNRILVKDFRCMSGACGINHGARYVKRL
ncbi:MAG: hydrogenase formation protein HypD [Nitrososphaerota archaeon]